MSVTKPATSFPKMMKGRFNDTVVSLAKVQGEARAELYQRWIKFFSYEHLVGDDVSTFDPTWSDQELAQEIFNADPICSLFDFLIEESLIEPVPGSAGV